MCSPKVSPIRSANAWVLLNMIVLRLYPSVPVNTRSALQTTTLPVGGGRNGKAPILVRKGEAVGYCVYTMHRRKDIYGDDAEQFRPSRWDEERLRKFGWAYLPFNGGPRTCPGSKSNPPLNHMWLTVDRRIRSLGSLLHHYQASANIFAYQKTLKSTTAQAQSYTCCHKCKRM